MVDAERVEVEARMKQLHDAVFAPGSRAAERRHLTNEADPMQPAQDLLDVSASQVEASSLFTEQLDDGQHNCLDKAATYASPDHELVFLQDLRSAADGNANQAGRATSPNDGPPPKDTEQ